MTQAELDRPLAVTDRIELRPWRLEESDRFYDIYSRAEVADWLGGPMLTDPSQAAEMIGRRRTQLAADPRFGSWAVVERATGVPAGTVILKPLPDGEGEIEIGWHLHPETWGRGLATEAATAVLAHGFETGLEEVWAVTDLANHRSAAVCGRLGMRLLGVTHRWYHEPSLMFWVGARAGQRPSLAPDEPAPARDT
jgi:RimJ/RimL family protein N-acetyltransferase